MAEPKTDETSTPDARRRLLEAGAELFSSFRPEDVLPGVRSVCRAAGLPTGSFYNCFADATDFHRALIAWLGANDGTAQVSRNTRDAMVGLAAMVEEARPTAAQAVAAMAAAAGFDGERMILDAGPSVRAQYLLSSLAEADGAVGDDIRLHYGLLYAGLGRNQAEGTQAMLDALGAEIRAPFTLQSVGMVITALTDGLVLRAKVEPDLDVVTLLEDATRALVVALVRHPDDHRDIDDLSAETFARAATRGLADLTAEA